jgi:4-coumarate--CoA ligase
MRIYKAEQSIDVPTDFNLTQLLNSTARPPIPGKPSLIATDDLENRTLTRPQLCDTAGRLAQGLTAAFHPAGQSRWAIILPNSIAFIEAVHTVLWLGGVFCPINHLLTAHEFTTAFSVCKPDYIIAYEPIISKLLTALNTLPTQPPILLAGASNLSPSTTTTYPHLNAYLSPRTLSIPSHPNTTTLPASIHLSSGTTGVPKGVLLTHHNYISNVLQLLLHDPVHWSPSTRVASYTPYCHIANTTIPLFLGPWTGMTHHIIHSYSLPTLLSTIEKWGATATQISAPAAVALATTQISAKYDLGTLRYLHAGSLPLGREVWEKFMGKGKGRWEVVGLYGMTEASPYVCWGKVGEGVPRRRMVGMLLPGMEGRLVLTDEGERGGQVEVEAPEGGPGELWIRGPNVTRGYVDNEEATRAAFRDGGWYNTGDVCTFSPEGYLTVVGRTKELIKVSGFQVSPTELEGYLNGHPAIQDVAVGPDIDRERMTEVPAAFVVLKDDVRGKEQKVSTLKDIQGSLDGKVSGYKKLKGGVWEVSSLPRTSTGKFIRKRLGENKTGLSSLEDNDTKAKL